ncbi:hypothetical protein TNCV_4396571 [Trichonephila clavipes]|uniref:Uncharacterized protein n=1 Tax=Trichonephila clavipes TaxID=2585209 RepID=A0A8X6W4U5_TRICX|nr:hypothetical protein TNCV_4396571 [Trichonephila clavipes]
MCRYSCNVSQEPFFNEEMLGLPWVTRESPHCYYPSLAFPIIRFVYNRAYLESFRMVSWASHEFERTRGKKFLTRQMKGMHLAEKTGDKPTQRDKPSNLGVKSREQANSTRQALQSRREKQGTSQLNETRPPILVCENDNY